MDIVGAIAIALLLFTGPRTDEAQVFTAGTFLHSSSRCSSSMIRCGSLPSLQQFQQAWARPRKFSSLWTGGRRQEKPASSHTALFKEHRLEGVCFSYEADGDEAREILCDVNLEVLAGEVVAVVGSSGAARARWCT